MEIKKPALLHYYCNCGACENQSETLIVEECHGVHRLGPEHRIYSGFYIVGCLGDGREAQCTFYETPDPTLPDLPPTLTFRNKDGSIIDIIELDDYELVYDI